MNTRSIVEGAALRARCLFCSGLLALVCLQGFGQATTSPGNAASSPPAGGTTPTLPASTAAASPLPATSTTTSTASTSAPTTAAPPVLPLPLGYGKLTLGMTRDEVIAEL
ncbi:MAG: hypothetical protein M0001_01365, partial [Treponema sp.]|nr:hypothetical protein [Treponema sp.]